MIRVAAQLPARSKSPLTKPTTVALQIDAGYVRAAPRSDGAHWIAAVVSKPVVPQTPHTHAHAYVSGYNPQQGLRQQAFLASIGIGLNVPVTVLSDGGEDISHACQLPSAADRVLGFALGPIAGTPELVGAASHRRKSPAELTRAVMVLPAE